MIPYPGLATVSHPGRTQPVTVTQATCSHLSRNDFNDLVWMMHWQLMSLPRPRRDDPRRGGDAQAAEPGDAASAIRRRLEALGHRVRVCVYTRKSGLAELLPKSQESNGDLYFPAKKHLSCVTDRSEYMYNPFKRLFFARQITGIEALGRNDIEMVVRSNLARNPSPPRAPTPSPSPCELEPVPRLPVRRQFGIRPRGRRPRPAV